jgi:hypothetical protein
VSRYLTPDDKSYKGVSLDAWPWRVSAKGNLYTTVKDLTVVIVARTHPIDTRTHSGPGPNVSETQYLVRAKKDAETIWSHLGTFDDEATAKREALTLLGVGRREKRPMSPRTQDDGPPAAPTPVGMRKITP